MTSAAAKVVTLSTLDCALLFPAASTAETVMEYAVPGVRPNENTLLPSGWPINPPFENTL